jgi:hypothetical protein
LEQAHKLKGKASEMLTADLNTRAGYVKKLEGKARLSLDEQMLDFGAAVDQADP